MKPHFSFRFFAALLPLLVAVSLHAQTVVTAPEAPFSFDPLQMHDFPARDFPITRYGARQGNVKATTEAFRKAMQACSKAGGGRVVVPEGEWLTGPVHFSSGCLLYLDEGSRLVFEDDPQLYLPAVRTSWEGTECMNYSPLIYAYECENVGIAGSGTIAPKMDFWRTWFARPEAHIQATRQLYAMCSTGIPVEHRRMEEGEANMRPHLIQFNRCTNVRLENFSIRESPFWTIHLYLCKDAWVHGLDVYAHGHNNDGIDVEMTSHAVIEDCRFDQGDDAVVLKAGRNQDAWRLATPTEKIVVRNCDVIQGHCLLGIGSEMSGGVRDVYMHDCHSADAVFRLFYVKTNHRRGGFVENVTMENVSATRMQRVFEIDTDVMYQWRTIVPTFETAVTRIRNITLRGAKCEQADAIYEIKGDSRNPVEGVTLENIHVGTVTKFINNLVNVRDLRTSGISWDNFGTPAPKPLYTDPVNGAPTDPLVIRNRDNGKWYMFYTSRRANAAETKGAEWVHGSPIGIAVSDNLADWKYLRDAEIDYRPDENPTYWAPAIVDDGKEYHMYLTYVPGIFSDWNHPRHIIHLTSDDLVNWKFQSELKLISDKVIDADVARLPDGTWRMWYNQEPGGKLIASADSRDLYNWTDNGLVDGIGNCEGPKAFFWKGCWWLICDEWKGFAVYRSDDALHWTRQPGNLLQTPGKGEADKTAANHCDVVVKDGRAYIFYFCHASEQERKDGVNPRRTVIQVAELQCSDDGKTISCDRDSQTFIR